MRNLIVGIVFLCFCNSSFAGVMFTVAPSDVAYFQVVQAGNDLSVPEGLYIGLLTGINTGTACGHKGNIIITDPKLIDRAYSGMMYAMATQKTMSFWIESKCVAGADQPLATIFRVNK